MKIPGGHDYDNKMVNPRMIRFDMLYQRDLDKNRVEQIVKKWNGDIFNEPKLSLRDGVFWCFNGQHTTVAWLKKFGEKPMPCKVYKGMTWLDECELFIEQNGISKDPTTGQKLKAAYEAKRQDVVEMVLGAQAAGFKVSFNNSRGKKTIAAVSTLFRAYAALGYANYTEMLGVIRDAWPNDEMAVSQQIIGGLAQFYKVYAGDFNAADLAKKLAKRRADEYITKADRRVVKEYARQMLKAYNFGRTSKRLEDRL